jgi:bifunctional DNase/RNase
LDFFRISAFGIRISQAASFYDPSAFILRLRAPIRSGTEVGTVPPPQAALVISRSDIYPMAMKNDVVQVQIRGILPANSGCALFVGNDEKVFVINVEPNMGAVIGMFLRDTPKERPLTHDLIQSIFKGFSITVERVVITELRNSTYFARLILQQQNELARKIVEIDARPSDCLALATAQKRPIYVTNALFEQVEDMTEVLDRINETGSETGGEAGSEPE